ncbi:MAG: hypothetical protein ACI802_001881, partial [Candidatus Paceibacteria bacterium]
MDGFRGMGGKAVIIAVVYRMALRLTTSSCLIPIAATAASNR